MCPQLYPFHSVTFAFHLIRYHQHSFGMEVTDSATRMLNVEIMLSLVIIMRINTTHRLYEK